jgi:hypothetical protein
MEWILSDSNCYKIKLLILHLKFTFGIFVETSPFTLVFIGEQLCKA